MKESDALKLLICAALSVTMMSEVQARSLSANGASASGFYGSRGNIARITPLNGRFGRQDRIRRFDTGHNYFPSAPFGPFASYPFAASGQPSAYDRFAPEPAARTVTIINRGPAFGEPGYVSRPIVYRLVPAAAVHAGTRRFKVERLEF